MTSRDRRYGEVVVACCAVAVFGTGVGVAQAGLGVPPRPLPTAAAPLAAAPLAATPFGGTAQFDTGRPVGLVVPSLGLDRDLVPLGRQRDGSLEVPTDYADVGVWSEGAASAPVVLAGHVDSETGPAVFFRLGELRPGDEVMVRTGDGRTVRHLVERVTQHAKDAFPTFEVFADDGPGALRLVTCGGTFDRAAGSYLDNVVVFARAAGG